MRFGGTRAGSRGHGVLATRSSSSSLIRRWRERTAAFLNLMLDKYKSRCVPMGNRMLKGRYYSESFAIGARIHILPRDITLVTMRRDFLAPFPSVTSQSNAVCIDDSCYLPKFGPLKINW